MADIIMADQLARFPCFFFFFFYIITNLPSQLALLKDNGPVFTIVHEHLSSVTENNV